jgi:hypothetical protein
MATSQLEEKARVITPRNSRRNEIVAILFLALGLLLSLCLISAAFNPTTPPGIPPDKLKQTIGLEQLAPLSPQRFFSSLASPPICFQFSFSQRPGDDFALAAFTRRSIACWG